MGKRGPKPVRIENLKAEATQWATFFYTLRDGQLGMVYLTQWGSWTTEHGRRLRRGRTLGAKIIPIDRRAAEGFIAEIKKAGSQRFHVSPPVFPDVKGWQQFKSARTVPAIRRAADMIRRWATSRRHSTGIEWSTTLEGTGSHNFSDAIRRHTRDLLRAKQLPNCPNDPASNDDKRILFFAKVMAGLTLGLSPLTATKRLGHWHLPRDWAEKVSKDFQETHPMPGTNVQEKPK